MKPGHSQVQKSNHKILPRLKHEPELENKKYQDIKRLPTLQSTIFDIP